MFKNEPVLLPFLKKCITFWSDRDIFDEASIAYMRQVLVQPPLIPPLAIPNVPYASPLAPKVQMVSPSKPYYELPAGLMTLIQVRNNNKIKGARSLIFS